MQVLVALADARGEILSRDDLIAACWEGRSVTDHSVNRVIQRLRALARACGSFEIETVIKVGYRLLERQPGEVGGGSFAAGWWPAIRGWRLAGGFAGVAAVAAIALVVVHPWIVKADAALAPVVTDGAPAPKAVAGELPDRLTQLLSKGGYKLRTMDSADADPTGATFLARANVDAGAQNLHLTLTLSEPNHRDVMWSEEFSRPKPEAQALVDEASSTTAAVMACALEWMSHSKHRLDPVVVKDLLTVCDLNVNTQERGEANKRRQDLARDIVSREPDFPPGLMLLATTDIGAAEELPARASRLRSEARAMAEHVLRVDPHFGGAYVVLSLLPPVSDNLAASYDTLARGLAISPDDAWINVYAASLLLRAGYLNEGVAETQRAVDLRPLDPWMLSMLVEAFTDSGRIGDARASADQGLALWPGHTELLMSRISIEARQGDPGRALSDLDDAEGKGLAWYTPDYVASARRMAFARKAGTAAAVAKAVFQTESALRQGSISESDALNDLMTLGAVDQSYALAESHPESIAAGVLFEPQAAGFRADRRFMPLAKKLGMLQFWRARGRWPDFCLAPNAPYDCAKAAEGL